jgi:serine phosphatase RsbU (regulator of sigma subunit)
MPKKDKKSIRKTIVSDFLEHDFWKNSKQDWSDSQEYYLNDSQKEKIKNMSKARGVFYIVYWLLRDMFLKLSANRRIVLVVSLVMFFHYQHLIKSGEDDAAIVLIAAIAGLIFLLMLELKDKMLAQDELHAGRAVQFAMMPDTIKQINHWNIWMLSRPAKEVGGDIIDYQEIDETRRAISLGDISGKGLAAALLMVKLQATIRALADNNTDLAVLAQKINKIYYRDKPKGSFASLVYAEPDDSGHISFFNAGHLPPMYVSNNEVNFAQSKSPALGILKSVNFQVNECKLNIGDYFIIYSDGLTEAMNNTKELYGIDRLQECINNSKKSSIEELAEAILSDIMLFLGENKPNDDMSLVIMQYI